MIPFENLVIKWFEIYVWCLLVAIWHIYLVFFFSDVPTLALKSHGISDHVTVR